MPESFPSVLMRLFMVVTRYPIAYIERRTAFFLADNSTGPQLALVSEK